MVARNARNARDALAALADAQTRSARRARALGLDADGQARWFRIENAAGVAGRSRAKVYLYDPIGVWFGTSPKEFVDELNELDVDEIELHVNSPGGSVYDGIAIMNALRQHDARVIGIVDGLAASAASYIAVGGCDELAMAEHSELFIHDAWGLCIGSAADMTTMAGDLDRLSDNIASIYARKAGGTVAAWREEMREERFYSAQAAVDAGLADRVGLDEEPDDDEQDLAAAASWDRSVFASARGRTAAVALRPTVSSSASAAGSTPPAASSAAGDTMKEESMLSDEEFAALAQKVGVPADADAATVLAAIDQALKERAGDDPETGSALAAGTRVVDQATYEDLVERAAAGDAARESETAARRDGLVASAVNAGKIPPSRREHWLALLEQDEEGTSAVLDKLAAGTIPVAEVGHAATGTDEDTDMPEYNALYGAKED